MSKYLRNKFYLFSYGEGLLCTLFSTHCDPRANFKTSPQADRHDIGSLCRLKCYKLAIIIIVIIHRTSVHRTIWTSAIFCLVCFCQGAFLLLPDDAWTSVEMAICMIFGGNWRTKQRFSAAGLGKFKKQSLLSLSISPRCQIWDVHYSLPRIFRKSDFFSAMRRTVTVVV